MSPSRLNITPSAFIIQIVRVGFCLLTISATTLPNFLLLVGNTTFLPLDKSAIKSFRKLSLSSWYRLCVYVSHLFSVIYCLLIDEDFEKSSAKQPLGDGDEDEDWSIRSVSKISKRLSVKSASNAMTLSALLILSNNTTILLYPLAPLVGFSIVSLSKWFNILSYSSKTIIL